MNTTTIPIPTVLTGELFYSPGAKAGLALVFLPCSILGLLLYRYSRRKLMGKETMDSRMINFYSAIAGGILGQFFFHTLPNSTGAGGDTNIIYSSISVFIFIGFFIMMTIQKCSRVNNEMDYYTAPQGTGMDIKHIIDPETVSENNYYKATDITGEQFGDDMWTLLDEHKELRRRRMISALFYTIMLFETILEGFFLVYNKSSSSTNGGIPVLIVMFYINKIVQTFVVGTVLIHGMFHVGNTKRTFFKGTYLSLLLLWCIACSLSGIPAFIDMEQSVAQSVMRNVWMSAIYSLAGGILFWIALYFVWLDRKHTNKRETAIRLFLFAILAVVAYVTGVFL